MLLFGRKCNLTKRNPYLCGLIQINMKKLLLILAVLSAFISAKAQQNGVIYSRDTLTIQQMMVDYATLNNQVRSFHNLELGGLAFTTVGIGTSFLGFMKASQLQSEIPLNTYDRLELERKVKNMKIVGYTGLAFSIVGGIMQVTGICKLKRDKLEITPNGVVIKLTPYE